MLVRLMLLLLMLALSACSAIELREQMAQATTAADVDLKATIEALEARGQAVAARATEAAATLAVLQTNASAVTTTPSPAEATTVPSISSADTVVYGSVPIDSDRLNTIAALAFDHEGQLLVSTRAGEIYRLSDEDGDGLADDRQLIFADADESLQQVAGMFMRGDSLILLNGDRLSQLRDSDGDGIYDTVRHLTEELPAGQTPLLASNGIVEAPDGRLFSADLNTGEILLIQLHN